TPGDWRVAGDGGDPGAVLCAGAAAEPRGGVPEPHSASAADWDGEIFRREQDAAGVLTGNGMGRDGAADRGGVPEHSSGAAGEGRDPDLPLRHSGGGGPAGAEIRAA